MVTDLARRYARALASGDTEAIARCYHPDARSYGPLAWPEQGAGAIAAGLARSAARLDALETELHDAFADPAGERAALRLVRRWSQGATRRSAIETRYLRLADGLITEEFAGPNTFQLADLELNQWGMVPADTGVDPNPEVLAASPTKVSGKRPETVPERFVDAFGRNDPDALLALYDPGFTLYSPIAWGLPGRDPSGRSCSSSTRVSRGCDWPCSTSSPAPTAPGWRSASACAGTTRARSSATRRPATTAPTASSTPCGWPAAASSSRSSPTSPTGSPGMS
jgi:hypothetical protein